MMQLVVDYNSPKNQQVVSTKTSKANELSAMTNLPFPSSSQVMTAKQIGSSAMPGAIFRMARLTNPSAGRQK
ncbi:hypothetical protein ACOSQ4_032683 [Xanthoceras sorbifolium]